MGSTIGILGGGQLGKMLCMAAANLGYKTLVYSDKSDSCAFDVATKRICAPYDQPGALREFRDKSDVVTFELENIPLSMCSFLDSSDILVRPRLTALQVSKDRRLEKQMARVLGIETPRHWIIESERPVPKDITYPVILKTARNGYDGKGQKKINSLEELLEVGGDFKYVPCVAEEVVDFEDEFSMILARDASGNMAHYAPFRNVHREGILRETFWPMDDPGSKITISAVNIARKIAEHLDVVGLLVVELFLTKDGNILFNEIAVRPHNSGHITLDCAVTSQFEQHIRAVAGLPLGDPSCLRTGWMENIIGENSQFDRFISNSVSQVYCYGKGDAPGRKLGHINHIDNVCTL